MVGFEVEPKSIDSKRITINTDGTCSIQSGQDMQKIDPTEENQVTMTYEVEWTSSETRWASRYVLKKRHRRVDFLRKLQTDR